MNRNSKCCQT